MIKKNEFIRSLSNFYVEYAYGGNSTDLINKMKFKDFVNTQMNLGNQNYVFHDITKDAKMFKLIKKLIPLPKVDRKLRISRLYAGSEGSGTNLHTHSVALNYLVSGKKLWIIFPNGYNNNQYVKRMNFTYQSIKETTVEWYENNKNNLEENIEHLTIIIQNTGDIILVPHGYYHAVINLESVFGITYSWY